MIISKKDWDAIQETLYLYSTGTADVIYKREEEDEFVALEEVDQDTLKSCLNQH